MWHSMFNLLVRSSILAGEYWLMTVLAVGAGLSFFVLKQTRSRRAKGVSVKKQEWAANAAHGALLAAGLLLCVFLWCIMKTVYDDHQSLLMKAAAAEAARDTYKQLVLDRDATIESMKKAAKDSSLPPH